MALKRSLDKLSTSIEDYKGSDLRQIFIKSGFEEQSDIFRKINDVISDESVTVKYILRTSKKDLFEEFGFVDEKKPIEDLKKKYVEKFDKIEVFQLLIQEIGFIDDDQSLVWYTYLEDNGIDGRTLLTVDEDEFGKGLKLPQSKLPVLENLMEKIKDDGQKSGAGSHTVNVTGKSIHLEQILAQEIIK